MTIDEFEPDALLAELNSKLLNVSITHQAFANCDTIDKSSVRTPRLPSLGLHTKRVGVCRVSHILI